MRLSSASKWVLALVCLGFPVLSFLLTKISPRPVAEVPPPPVVQVPVAIASPPEPLGSVPSSICPSLKSICRLGNSRRDPTGFGIKDGPVELAALRQYREIAQANRGLSMEEIDELYVKEAYSEASRKRLITLFDWVKKTLIALMETHLKGAVSDFGLRSLVKSLSDVALELPPPASVYQDSRDLLTRPVVLFKPADANQGARIRVGGAYPIRVLSFYQIVFTFAHELAHAIDPCEIRHLKEANLYYKTVAECFLKLDWLPDASHLSCGRGSHLAEVYADFWATHITVAALKRFGETYLSEEKWAATQNAVGDLCGLSDAQYELDFSNHPTPATRIERIFSASPPLRAFLSCEKSEPYCSLSGKYIP